MALCKLVFCFSAVFSLSFVVSLAHPPGFGWWGGHGPRTGSRAALNPDYYKYSCPQANHIVVSVLEKVIDRDPRMAASLLRLHFHDCFVQGCDASVLLDSSANIASEKNAGPNRNSLRGFEVMDQIKSELEKACPHTVSCADILAMAARESTVLERFFGSLSLWKQSGGPNWELPLGRKDSRRASLSLSNQNIPAPNSTIQTLVNLFKRQGLNQIDLVALSGGHTIGVARCTTFKQRLYSQNGADLSLEKTYSMGLKSVCPSIGGDNNISPLDFASPARFDNTYFKLILSGKGLLTSDQVLFTGDTLQLVKSYAEDQQIFFNQFAKSMVRMGSIGVLTGFKGEVRNNCRRLN
ncbi:Peroxidase 9 [Linum perenne]